MNQVSNTADSNTTEAAPQKDPTELSAPTNHTTLPYGLSSLAQLAASIQPYLEQNRRIVEQFTDALALHQSAVEKLNMNLAAPIQLSKILGEQIEYFGLQNALQSPALELADTVNLAISSLLAETSTPKLLELVGHLS